MKLKVRSDFNMEEIIANEVKYELKQDYLTNGEVNFIITECLKIYNKSGDIEGYKYSPLNMMTNFYSLLFQYCINGFETDNVAMYEEMYSNDVQGELLRHVRNAFEAYELLNNIVDKMNSIENIIDSNLKEMLDKILSKMPDVESMNKMLNILPEELKDAVSKYQSITGVSLKEDE